MLKMKKGYFFLVDGILAIVILTVGFMLISSHSSSQDLEIPISIAAQNSMDLLSEVNVDDVCEGCSCSLSYLESNCAQIKNMNQTLLDLFGEWYADGKRGVAEEGFGNITEEKDLFHARIMNTRLIINGDEIYASGDPEGAGELIASKKIIFGYYEIPSTGEVIFWGPYVAEVHVWPR